VSVGKNHHRQHRKKKAYRQGNRCGEESEDDQEYRSVFEDNNPALLSDSSGKDRRADLEKTGRSHVNANISLALRLTHQSVLAEPEQGYRMYGVHEWNKAWHREDEE
jgi:hypothetical protein